VGKARGVGGHVWLDGYGGCGLDGGLEECWGVELPVTVLVGLLGFDN